MQPKRSWWLLDFNQRWYSNGSMDFWNRSAHNHGGLDIYPHLVMYRKGMIDYASFIRTRLFFAHSNEAAWSNMDTSPLEGGAHRRFILGTASSFQPRTDAA